MDEPTQRVCTKCREVKPLDEFSAAPRGKYGRKASCKACDAARHARLHPPKPRVSKPRREPLPGEALKRCTKCGVEKTIDEFSLARKATATTNDIYKSSCKRCASERAMEWYRANPGRTTENKRRFNLEKLYGLTVQQYNDMLEAQHGACAICGQTENGKFRFSVDHDHENGKVRGLLCNRCNRAIGLFGDDLSVMRRAISYLMRARRIHLGGQ